MRAICTGISGTNKRDYIYDLMEYAASKHRVKIVHFDLGDEILNEAERLFSPSNIPISRNRIDKKVLDLPRGTSTEISATVFERILAQAADQEHSLISMHACFRWKRAIMHTLPVEYVRSYKPTHFFTIIGNPEDIERVLKQDPKWKGKLSDRDIAAWQEEEIATTRVLAGYMGLPYKAYHTKQDVGILYNDLFRGEKPVTPSFSLYRGSHKTVYCTSIVGSEARNYLRHFCSWARTKMSHEIALLDLWKELVEVAKEDEASITEDNILNHSEDELHTWRCEALRRIRNQRRQVGDCIIFGRSCIRQPNRMILAFNPEKEVGLWYRINPEIYVTLIDNLLSTRMRLADDNYWKNIHMKLREIAIWRDEEVFITKIMADYFRKPHFLLPVMSPFETFYRITFDQGRWMKVYLSYPITEMKKDIKKWEAHRKKKDDLLQELRQRYAVYDPLEIGDGVLLSITERCPKEIPHSLDKHFLKFAEKREVSDLKIIRKNTEFLVEDGPVLDESELKEVQTHIDDQIVERDFRLIDQSDWVVVFYPVEEVSPGVLTEVVYGYSHGREVFLIWQASGLSPFLKYHSTVQPCRSKEELLKLLKKYEMR